MEYPERVSRLKPSLRAAAELDAGAFVLPGERRVKPYEGELVWLDPYLDSETELQLMELQDRLGEDPDNKAAFEALCDLLDVHVFGWTCTDKFGEPLPQPGTAGCWDRAPSRFVIWLINELLGVESEGEGQGG